MILKRFQFIIITFLLAITLCACGEQTHNISEIQPSLEEKETSDIIVEDKESHLNNPNKPKLNNDNITYKLGDVWTVENNWSLKIDSATTTDYRNSMTDKNPVQVVIIKYTYENLGYEGETVDLILEPKTIIDSDKKLGSTYPAIINVAKDTPVGAICQGAEYATGLNTESDIIQIHFKKTDTDGNLQKAVFEVPVN